MLFSIPTLFGHTRSSRGLALPLRACYNPVDTRAAQGGSQVSKTDARRSSTLSFAIKIAVAILVVVAAVYMLLEAELQRALKARLDRLHALGVPKTWAELAPPPIPDQDNAALLYQRAFDQPVMSSDDAMLVREFLRRSPAERQARLPQMQAILAKSQVRLDLVRQAASRPRCRFPGDWGSSPYETGLDWGRASPWPAMRQEARVLAADALVAAQVGETERAVNSCRAGIRMSRHAGEHPTTIGVLVGIVIEAITLKTLAGVLQEADFSAGQCKVLFDELQRLDPDTSFRSLLRTDTYGILWVFELAEKEPGRTREMLQANPGRAGDVLAALYLSRAGRLVRLNEEIAYADLVERLFATAAKPPAQGVRECVAASGRMEKLPSYYLITDAVSYDFPVARAYYRAVGYRSALQVALALEAYHTRRGDYPDSLTALRDYPGWELPNDLYSGKPFVYRREGDGYLLYSWGDDLDDDGGRAFVRDGGRAFVRPGLDGDWVWQAVK